MDRISALRNVEDALRRFEDGEVDLSELEREVRGTLRTYATEFEGDLAAYRVESAEEAGSGSENGNPAVDGTVVLAGSKQGARERVRELVDRPGPFAVERFDGE
ncbi:hypothetical protein [Halosimplex pelagicum]|uniref:Uncharacterized protein n=1 Tax=Halosimplex pelagicum TaxID=869886 RepID=A0A7D5P6S8_9EURY|nr:hypothetical protein [Halosimplex pelagicum]QLH80581.1 hypothetical protein HZS54_02560 [Halosimplex pelagicum]